MVIYVVEGVVQIFTSVYRKCGTWNHFLGTTVGDRYFLVIQPSRSFFNKADDAAKAKAEQAANAEQSEQNVRFFILGQPKPFQLSVKYDKVGCVFPMIAIMIVVFILPKRRGKRND